MKYIVYVAILAFLSSEAAARFLIDDVQEDIRQDQPRQPDQKQSSPPAQSQAPSKTDTNPGMVPPEYPRNMSVTILNGEKNSVQITWDVSAEARDSFVVLRSNQLQNSADIVLNSIPIKVVASDSLKVVLDRNLPPGRYFYAIVPKTKFDDKNIRLYPGENYSTNPMIIYGDGELTDSRTVASIRAVTIEDRSVLLTWEPINNFTGEYVIFRSKSPIDTPDKLNNADPVGRIVAAKSRFLDSDASPGRHFYAIACKTIDGIMYSDLKKGFNYTDDAVFIGGTIGIRGIRAKMENGSVLITWKMTADSFNKMFYLLRTETRPSSRESLAGAYIVDTVMSSTERYLDKGLPNGKFYYVLAPMNYRESDDFILIGGVNVTDPPIVSSKETKELKEESASKSDKQEKKESPLPQNKEIKPLPKKADIGPSDEDILAYLEELKDLSQTKPSPQKKEEKTAVPEKNRPDFEPKIPWEDEKEAEIETDEEQNKTPGGARTEETKKEPEKKSEPKKPAQESGPKKTDRKLTEKKEPSRTSEPVHPTKLGTAIDGIIGGAFSRGDYSQSINMLKSALRKSPSPAESAKAKLYIARSYIELGRYRDALGYLSGSDVKRYYPRECGFWQDYSIDRLK
jgi:tetratricopeptide (TPR) repeat protein